MAVDGKTRCALLVAFGMVVLSHAALPPYDVTALDFVSVRAAGAHLPKSVDVVGEDGNVVARNLVVPDAGGGNVSTVPFRKVRTKRIGVRIADSDGWQLAAVRVRVPTFAGHLILHEEKDND